MADNYELTEQQKKELKDAIDDQMNRMGEVFSQCWESEEFKQAFMKDPKAIFKEYGVNFNPDKEYVIIDSPKRSIVHVLPHDGVKPAVEGFNKILAKKVEDLSDEDGKQILLDGWKYEIYQNTPDKYYIVIPHSPEDLSPEELEMVNGGCFFAAFIFVAEAVILATTAVAAAEALALAFGVVAIAVEAAAAAMAVIIAGGWAVILTVTEAVTANMAFSGYFVTADASAINTAAAVTVKPR
ncbi:MAG: hypothetical protein K5886_03880 [Lachnospiraceae bacterium]|nr:hypothetical protein [Lachnospiraceae bacterium]